MNQINSIYTTVSKGKVHIAADTQYIGSVDSYNNCFTRFFAWLFGFSMSVNFDGMTRSVNKESYSRLVCSLTQNEKINDIRSASLFRPIAERADLPISHLKMRDVIAQSDREALFQNLAIAISRGDTAIALQMIGKGAELDATYYERDQLPLSFSRDTADLSRNSRYTFTVFHASPILQAAREGNAVVCRFLQEAGANPYALGKEYTFERQIIHVDKHLEFAMRPTPVAHHYHREDAKGNECDQVRYRVEYRPELREKTRVVTEDSRSDERTYQLGRNGCSLREYNPWFKTGSFPI